MTDPEEYADPIETRTGWLEVPCPVCGNWLWTFDTGGEAVTVVCDQCQRDKDMATFQMQGEEK
jgi:ribosomal protein S27E